MLAVCGMMMVDLVHNIWSWDQVSTPSKSLLEVLKPLLG
jgi:hypothetical protein